MEDPKLVAASVIALAVTLFAILSMRPIARRLGLVDKPDARKRHRGRIPLIGGLCFFLGTLVGLSYLGYLDPFSLSLLAGGTLIVFTGVIDDFSDLSVRSRLLVEAGAAVLVITASGYYVNGLGQVFGFQSGLGLLGIPLTVIAVIGLINAFNMLDGLDGLAASMAMVSIAAILLFTSNAWSTLGVLLLLQVLFAALIPYLFVNLGWPDGRKVFMGDAGSTLIGFLVAWSLIYLSHRSVARLAPVDALWCVAIPVMDTFAVMHRRIRAGRSPFKPDRQHLHHLLLDAGIPARVVLVLIVAAAGLLSMLGYALRNAPEIVSALTFVAVIVVYALWLPRLAPLPRLSLSMLPSGVADAVSALVRGVQSKPGSSARIPQETLGKPAAGTVAANAAMPRAPLKMLCLLAERPDGIRIAPIAQQLSEDDRFESTTVCITTVPEQESEDLLPLFRVHADHKLEIANTATDVADITSATLGGIQRLLGELKPDMVLVPSDAMASIATTLAAYYREIPVVCIDAGASAATAAPPGPGDASRGIVRTLASLHVAQSARAGRDLVDEGVPVERILVAGDPSSDALHSMLQRVHNDVGLNGDLARRFPYLRVDSPLLFVIAGDLSSGDFEALADALRAVARQRPDVDIACPVHMGCHVQRGTRSMLGELPNVHPIGPLDCLASAYLLDAAYLTFAGNDVRSELLELGKPMLLVDAADNAIDAADIIHANVRRAGAGHVAIADHVLTLLDEGQAYESMCTTARGNDACERLLDALVDLRSAPETSARFQPGPGIPKRARMENAEELS